MEELREMLTSIDLENLLKIFDIQIGLGVLVFFIIFKSLFAKILIKIYYKLTKNKKNPKDSIMYKPLNFFFLLLGIFLMINISLQSSKRLILISNAVFQTIVVYYITKAIATLITEESKVYKKFFKSENKSINKFTCKILRGILWIISFVFVVKKIFGWDIDFGGIGTLVTGLGIGSAAIALAAQDLVKGMLSGATILTDKPFVIGDWIEVGEFQGSVIDITFRSTRIKAANNTVITIPNSTITSTSVINWNRLTSRRFDCVLNLSLETPSEKVRKVVKEIKLVLQNNPEVIKETVEVNVNAISSCSTDIKIFLYVRQSEYVKFLKAQQDILCSLLFLVEKENIDLAYPTQTLYVREGKGESEE